VTSPDNSNKSSARLDRATVVAKLRETVEVLDALGMQLAAVHVSQAIDALTKDDEQ